MWNSSVSVNFYQCLSGREGRTCLFVRPYNLSPKSRCCRADCGQEQSKELLGGQTPEATETAMTPLVPITSESERTRIAAGSPNVCTN